MSRDRSRTAAFASLALPTALLAGAYISEMYGLVACEMCWWQRYAHFAAIPFGLLALTLAVTGRPAWSIRGATVTAAMCVLASGLIGAFHAGVEYHWWNGITACTAQTPRGLSTADFLKSVMNQPFIRCDVAQWTMFGVSLAGWNAIISGVGSLIVIWMAAGRNSRT